MNPLALIQLISTIAGVISDVTDIAEKVHSLNLKPGEAVPQEHVDAVNTAMTKLKDAWQPPGFSWEDNHAGE